MTWTRRPLAPGEVDIESLVAWALPLTLLLAWAVFQIGLTTPGCPALATIGIPCPACGSTRAFHALFEGRLLDAFLRNPAFTLLTCALPLWWLHAIRVSGSKRPRLRLVAISPRWRALLLLLLALHWSYLILQYRVL